MNQSHEGVSICVGVSYHNYASQDIYPDNLQVFSFVITDVCKIHAELVEMNPLVISLVLLRLGHLVSSDVTFGTSGNFYQKVSDDRRGTEASTESFLPCSLKDGCKYVGIPVGSAGDKVYSASMIQELQSMTDKMQVWHKVEPKQFKSCKAAKRANVKKNGIVKLSLSKNVVVDVYCNMVKDKGGWIVFQRRVSRDVNFHRNWKEYEKGFGNLRGSFWLGLKTLHHLTSKGKWTLRIDLKRTNGEQGYAKYTGFKIGSREEKYKLKFDKYSYTGNIGDALKYHHGVYFSTWDNDNDDNANSNCARTVKGGWWFTRCYRANLNSYYPGTVSKKSYTLMMTWKAWKDTFADINFSEMKIREDD